MDNILWWMQLPGDKQIKTVYKNNHASALVTIYKFFVTKLREHTNVWDTSSATVVVLVSINRDPSRPIPFEKQTPCSTNYLH